MRITTQPPTVLLIEDDEDNLEIYTTFLEYRGYRVLVARDGDEGLRRAAEDAPDLILLDISIPKTDGWEVARRLRESSTTRAIPIFAVTAHVMERDRSRAEQLGLEAFHAKPIEPLELGRAVDLHFGRTDGP